MDLKTKITGVQHIGVPTNDIEATIRFYEGIGFDTIYRTVNEAANEQVAFLQLGNLVMEIYENHQASMHTGAIDHIALDVKEIESVFSELKDRGYELPAEGIQGLPFWENGVRFFTITGPNAERIEFCERL
ncbi:MAG: VOC family protein [Muribaculaceae bacterium]|nr:VOC family protein [Muribaculaceae bacterium]